MENENQTTVEQVKKLVRGKRRLRELERIIAPLAKKKRRQVFSTAGKWVDSSDGSASVTLPAARVLAGMKSPPTNE